MAAAKKQTKKDLENKIAELEVKLNQLATQLEAKPAPKPAEVKPTPKKSPGSLPKGFEPPVESKPAETTEPPATVQAALENAYMNAPMTDFHQYRAKVTGYTPAANRYFVRLTAPVGTVPTTNWNDQKTSVTGYTQPSNQYFATRPRLAYHPADKRFDSFSGVKMTVEGITEQAPTPEPAKPKGTLPKGTKQTQQAPPTQETGYSNESGKSRQEQLDDYESDYLQRMEDDRIADQQAYLDMVAAEAQAKAKDNRGSLPKGFEPQPEPEAPKSSKGTLPKGF